MNTEHPSLRTMMIKVKAVIANYWPWAITLVIAPLLILTLPTYWVGLLSTIAINALVAIGLSFVLGTGQVSLGHAAFVGVGAYACAILTRNYGVPAALSIPIAVLLCVMVAFVLGKVTLRLRGHSLPLATLAYGIAIYVCFVGANGLTGGASGMSDIPPLAVAGLTLETRGMACLAWVCLGIAYFAYGRIYRGRMGRIAKAIRAHGLMATAFGANVPLVKLKVFVLSAALAALAGCLYAFYMRFLSPTSFAIGGSFNYLIMVVLGGVAHPIGAILGAIFFVAIEIGAQYLFANLLGVPGNLEPMLFGAILIVMLLRWPNGLLTWLKLDKAVTEVKAINAAPQAALKLLPVRRIDVVNVSKTFGGIQALKGVSITLLSRQITGLIGPNGAGKSTLFNTITGVSGATSGEVLIDGAPMPIWSRDVIRAGVARTFQHVQLVPELTVLQNVMIGGYVNGRAGLLSCAVGLDREEEFDITQRALKALYQVELTSEANRPVAELPLAIQRMVEVARALVSNPAFLLLDEPAAGLRLIEKERLVKLLQSLRDEQGMAILLVEHDMELVMSCVDHIYVLNQGELMASGDRHQIQNNPAVIAAYLGDEQ